MGRPGEFPEKAPQGVRARRPRVAKKSSRGRCSSGRPKDVQKTAAGSPDEVDRTTERPEPRARERKRQELVGLEPQACRQRACALPLNQQAMLIVRAITDTYGLAITSGKCSKYTAPLGGHII